MKLIKKIIVIFFGNLFYIKLAQHKKKFVSFFILLKAYLIDFKLFYRHSTIFRQNSFEKIESLLILKYHSLEKGFLHNSIRFSFGKQTVIEIIKLLKREDIVENNTKTQIAAAYLSICTYYELHIENNQDISSFYSKDDYDFFKSISILDVECTENMDASTYFRDINKNFYDFSLSRSSVRDFSGELVPFEKIVKVIDIAKYAPSVCNRQPVKIYYLDNKNKIDSIFDIQKGLKGYSDTVNQLLVVVSDRNYFYTTGERNQFFIDGGLFLMNLLHSLHYYAIAACPAHWGLNHDADQQIMKILKMKGSEKVICLVPIGIPKNNFKTTLSLRRSTNEILIKVSEQ